MNDAKDLRRRKEEIGDRLLLLVVLVVLILLLIIVSQQGCSNEELLKAVADPNSAINKTATAIERTAPVIGAGARATGAPWGAVVGLVSTIIATVAGVYNNYRKKLVIKGKDKDLENIRVTTQAIVEAIEKVSDVPFKDNQTIGDVVKQKVKSELEDKKAYAIGKMIITTLKTKNCC